MPKKSNKKSNKVENEIVQENENVNEENVDLKLLNSKILKQQKDNYVNYVNNFLKCDGVVSLAF
ncbi:MAG: hypothetical protein ACK53Y_08035 [bacterium]|jgi:hypothetical protein